MAWTLPISGRDDRHRQCDLAVSNKATGSSNALPVDFDYHAIQEIITLLLITPAILLLFRKSLPLFLALIVTYFVIGTCRQAGPAAQVLLSLDRSGS